jgi:hypothetical protein
MVPGLIDTAHFLASWTLDDPEVLSDAGTKAKTSAQKANTVKPAARTNNAFFMFPPPFL